MSNGAADDWSDYNSGPFCRHYSDPYDCDTPCGSCGHPCCRHREECEDDGCACDTWTEAGEETR